MRLYLVFSKKFFHFFSFLASQPWVGLGQEHKTSPLSFARPPVGPSVACVPAFASFVHPRVSNRRSLSLELRLLRHGLTSGFVRFLHFVVLASSLLTWLAAKNLRSKALPNCSKCFLNSVNSVRLC